MLVELSVVEQRYHAVMEVLAGAPVTEVAARYGVSRKSVHAWLNRYAEHGLSGLVDRSHRPRSHPWRLAPRVEALVVQLRIDHPKWGPRRIVFELGKVGVAPAPSRSPSIARGRPRLFGVPIAVGSTPLGVQSSTLPRHATMAFHANVRV